MLFEPGIEPEADDFLLRPQPDPQGRLADGGPRYQETPPDPALLAPGTLAEPFNTATATIFILIVALWTIRLRGRYSRFLFLTAMLPILLAGGIGGTLYHATRSHMAWFLLDVIPISLLGLAGAIYLTVRLGRGLGMLKVGLISLGVIAAYVAVNKFVFRTIVWSNPNVPVNLSYLSLAIIVVVPIAATLWRTRFAHYGWVLAGLACFAHAWFFRLVDNTGLVTLEMGTHWLWHIYGAATTMFLFEYFYRVKRDEFKSDSI
ncbi:hypothetical protein BH11PLA2_BH11PLA2_50510 [soil metagenome]